MKKTNFYCFLFILSFLSFSCTKSDPQSQESVDSQINLVLKSAGDLKYDVLGQGYDITGTKDDYSSVRLPVINIAAFQLAQPARVLKDDVFGDVYSSNFQDNSKSFMSSIAVDTKTSATAEPFSGSITKYYSNYRSYSSQYSFAIIDQVITHSRIQLNADNSMLQNYLTDPFIADLLTKSGDILVQKYGTHVLIDIKTGGKMRMIYKSTTTQTDKKETVKAGAVAAVSKLFGWQTGIEYNSTLTDKNSEGFINYETTGGSTPIVGTVDVKTGIPTINLGAWGASVHSGIPGTAYFLSTDYSKIIPIYELVVNATKKTELKVAVENYINSHKLKMLSPFYRYYNSAGRGHLYTTDNTELQGVSGWAYEGIEGYLFNNYEMGTVRLYRYYNSGTKDHFYTINFSTLGSGNSTWFYESSFIYYVYQNQISGTVPLYRYYNSSKKHHFYTTNWSTLGEGKLGYSLEKKECYIFPQ
ncbi:MAG: hypothetical protein K0M40_09155 [Prolixibacteraceae bacterium]|nr:hypothetical protein [Prolixibacteraceae bacterium]